MARHEVWLKIPNGLYMDEKHAVQFVVQSNEEKLGVLRVSKRGVWWRPYHGKIWKKKTWEEFAEWISA